MSIIWATRGKNWGFRFLRDGGTDDVLRVYDDAFAGLGNSLTEFKSTHDTVAMRIPDPLSRRDRAGRIIPHEFIIAGSDAQDIDSRESAEKFVWAIFADEYAQIWDK